MEVVFYNESGKTLEQVCPERWLVPHPWKYSRPARIGL